MFRGQLQRVDHAQHFIEVAACRHRVNEDQLNLLVRADDVNISHGRVIGRRALLWIAFDVSRKHAVQF